MIVKEVCGFVQRKGILDFLLPLLFPSSNWKQWNAIIDLDTCEVCRSHHGKIYAMDEAPDPVPPVHFFCRCKILPVLTIEAGKCTKEGENGADWWLWHKGILPDYYIRIADLIALGWKQGKAPATYAPEKMVYGGIYRNDDGHLPSAPGRIWYEADLDYYGGRRNAHRILWSNDGLIFVTFDHYETFYEVIGG